LNPTQRLQIGCDVVAEDRREFRGSKLLGFLLRDEGIDGVVVAFLINSSTLLLCLRLV